MGVSLSLVAVLLAQAPSGSDPPTLTTRIERAVEVADPEALQQCRRELEQTGEGGTRTALERYTLAYVDWRESQLVQGRKKRKRLLKEAQATLESVVADDPDNVEALSLLGAVYGIQITGMWSRYTPGKLRAGNEVQRHCRVVSNQL